MSSQENIQIVQKAYQDFVGGNIPAILESLDEGVDWFIPGPKHLIPFAGQRRGRQEVAQFFSELAASLSAREFEPQEYIGDMEKVVALGRQKWQVKSTGRTYADDWAHVFWIANGKIVRFKEYHDTEAEAAAHLP
jgi:uncharacterized protein